MNFSEIQEQNPRASNIRASDKTIGGTGGTWRRRRDRQNELAFRCDEMALADRNDWKQKGKLDITRNGVEK